MSTVSHLTLLTTGKVSHFAQVTSDPWMVEVMKGYHLEFSHPPFQASPSHTLAKSPSDQMLINTNLAGSGQNHP